ncbi:MAG: lysophospholipid acyltransferase family protein [Acidobacteria bacterium]|nr:lysophospholipid acyltransferase family protein [Acidobacteriota bacterium]
MSSRPSSFASRIEAFPSPPVSTLVPPALSGLFKKVLALDQIFDHYQHILTATPEVSAKDFFDQALSQLKIQYQATSAQSVVLPSGPLVIVANHPFGVIEGMILCSQVFEQRPDAKLMANSLLSTFAPIRSHCIFVDPFGSTDSPRHNLAPLRQAIQWVRDGGALIVFPAGEVSHLTLDQRSVLDPPWSPTIARLVRKSEAGVVPVFFEGRNSGLFQVAGLAHPRLRTLLLPRECLNKQKSEVSFTIGKPIGFDHLTRFETDSQLIEYLRFRTYHLKHQLRPASITGLSQWSLFQHQPRPVSNQCFAPDQLALEVDQLDTSQKLAESGELAVYVAPFAQIPRVMQEIGRLRELTFRLTGEGTGLALDLDWFDQHYTHLFIWNQRTSEVVGAYRLARVDQILESKGVKGLYTSTLFRFSKTLFQHFPQALELGRSFVRPEYQKSFSPLLLLWKGIGAFVCQNPQYKYLLGAVSMSQDYTEISRQMLVHYLTRHESLPEIFPLIQPRHPFRPITSNSNFAVWAESIGSSLDVVSDFISQLEPDHKGVPVLVRQYLKLGGKLLGFNVDPGFHQALDGLILVDLTQTPRRNLERYLGKQETQAFLQYHSAKNDNVVE